MSTFSIPNAQGQIRQANKGDLYGELWASHNIDLNSNPGKILASRPLKRIATDTNLSAADVVAVHIHEGKFYFATTDTVYDCSVSDDPTVWANWSEIVTLGTEDLGFETDMVTFGNLLLISLGTDIMSWIPATSTKDDNWWVTTISGTALTVDKPHMMHVHRGGQETLFVTDGNLVRYYNATAGHSTVTLDASMTASCITSGVDATWVGTYTESSEYAYVYEIYVGEEIASVPVARRAYRIDGRAVLAMDVIDNVPYIITDKGHIQAFSGSGFKTVASFPFAHKSVLLDGIRPGLIQDTSISRPVHPKGMRTSGDSLFIFINTRNEDTDFDETHYVVDERSPGGVWEYNATTGALNHRFSLCHATTDAGQHTYSRSTPLLIVDNQFTRILCGGEPEIGASAVGLFGEDRTTAPEAYFITPEISADTIQESWEKVILKARTLADTESIEIKYRTSKNPAYPYYNSVTWLNATQFVSTDTTWVSVEVGDEVEIITGVDGGRLCHITRIELGTTNIITVDESHGALNQVNVVRVQNWKRIPTTYTSADGEFKSIGVTKTTPWVQFKVVLNGAIEFRSLTNKGNAKTTL